jgi:hypothetical protein
MIDFSFMMTLASGLPVEIEGAYDDRDSFTWEASHLCKEEIYHFSEDDLSITDRNRIDHAVIEYCSDDLEKEWEND